MRRGGGPDAKPIGVAVGKVWSVATRVVAIVEETVSITPFATTKRTFWAVSV